jgi:hypothetical protein
MVRKVDALYDVAEALGYDGDKGKHSVDAVNDINVTLGYDGERKRRMTDALADLATVVDGGGGGGVNLGSLGIAASASGTPEVGKMSAEGECIAEVRIGNQLVLSAGDTSLNSPLFAAGLTLSTLPVPNSEVVCTAYVVTVDSNGRYATVDEWDGTLTRREVEVEGAAAWVWDFVMPELVEGESLELFIHLPSSST